MARRPSYPESDPSQVEYWLNYILKNYQQRVTSHGKNKTLIKFGESDVVGTSFSTLWIQGGDETYVSDNLINTISSSSDNDTGIGVKVEYHTIDTATGNFSFGVQSIELAGQTEVALSVPCARVSRVFNDSTTALAGDVYVYETDTVVAGVPQTSAKIHAKMVAGVEQTQKAATTISSVDWYVITDLFFGLTEKTSAWAECHLEIRNASAGKVFRPITHFTASDQAPFVESLKTPIFVPRNHDVRMRALANTANVSCLGFYGGYLLTNWDGES